MSLCGLLTWLPDLVVTGVCEIHLSVSRLLIVPDLALASRIQVPNDL